ncbi:MAG: ABC transporter ATP-binding protein [Alphaproteobacteria bacterium]|nr:ABC transporter ATP-binding protein [Alphaproteobacteria bacterium]
MSTGAPPEPVLRISHLSKSFEGLRAIDDVSLSVLPGQCFGIIGANGAGKTTLLNLVTGYLRPSAGDIRFEGRPIGDLAPYRIAHLGIGRTFQIVQPFAEMTVRENVMTGALFSTRGSRRSLAEARDFCDEPLAMVGLEDQADLPAGMLTLGAKKKLELARVLATEPRLMLLDEVMGGLTHSEIDDIVAIVERVNDAGTTVVMVEHLVHVVTYLCDHVFVLDFGRELFQGSADAVLSNREVVEAYLGKPAAPS